MRLKANGFTFLEIMGALLIFSLLGTAILIAQGSIAQSMRRSYGVIVDFFSAKYSYQTMHRSSPFVLEKDAQVESHVTGIDTDGVARFDFLLKAADKEGIFARFYPCVHLEARVLGADLKSSPIFTSVPVGSYVAPVISISKDGAKPSAENPEDRNNNTSGFARSLPQNEPLKEPR